MTGKEIADNLRAHREQWTPFYYHKDGKYCVIGLKLHELGVPVEQWGEKASKRGLHAIAPSANSVDLRSLVDLQVANDSTCYVDNVIAWCEARANKDFPIEALAQALGQAIPPEDEPEVTK